MPIISSGTFSSLSTTSKRLALRSERLVLFSFLTAHLHVWTARSAKTTSDSASLSMLDWVYTAFSKRKPCAPAFFVNESDSSNASTAHSTLTHLARFGAAYVSCFSPSNNFNLISRFSKSQSTHLGVHGTSYSSAFQNSKTTRVPFMAIRAYKYWLLLSPNNCSYMVAHIVWHSFFLSLVVHFSLLTSFL